MNKPRIPVRHLPNNSSSLATDPRSIAIAQNNARIRFYAGLPEDDEDEAPTVSDANTRLWATTSKGV